MVDASVRFDSSARDNLSLGLQVPLDWLLSARSFGHYVAFNPRIVTTGNPTNIPS